MKEEGRTGVVEGNLVQREERGREFEARGSRFGPRWVMSRVGEEASMTFGAGVKLHKRILMFPSAGHSTIL